MAAEEKIREQMQALGIYDPAYEPSIKMLCIEERELTRTMRAWKNTAPLDENGKHGSPSPLNPLYDIIKGQRKDISVLRESLGLTPKGLTKLKGKDTKDPEKEKKDGINARLDAMAARCKQYER